MFAMMIFTAVSAGAVVGMNLHRGGKRQPCDGCKYEHEHEGKKVCKSMTRKHGERCDAYRKADK